MLLESIIRIGYRKAFHQSISAHFCEYGGGLDLRNEGIPPDNIFYFFLLNGIKPVIIPSVYFYKFKAFSHLQKHLSQSFLHRQSIRLSDSHLVDNLGTDNPHSSETKSQRDGFLHHLENLPPLLGRKFLGIVEQGREVVLRSGSHGARPGDDRPSPGATPCFINSEEKEIFHVSIFIDIFPHSDGRGRRGI